MTERKRGLQPKPVDPDLLPSQAAFKAVSDEMLKHKTNDRVTFVHFPIKTDASELFERLQHSSLNDILLQPGESFSIPNAGDYYEDLGLVVGEAPATRVHMTHLGWREEKRRIDPQGPKEPPFKIVEYPGEFDWIREIDINIWFENEKNEAFQRLSLYDSSMHAGEMPHIVRTVYAPEYAETGYEGHNQTSRPFKDEQEVMLFVDLAKELFGKRVKPSSTASASK